MNGLDSAELGGSARPPRRGGHGRVVTGRRRKTFRKYLRPALEARILPGRPAWPRFVGGWPGERIASSNRLVEIAGSHPDVPYGRRSR